MLWEGFNSTNGLTQHRFAVALYIDAIPFAFFCWGVLITAIITYVIPMFLSIVGR
jgi:hypothetical protein